MLSEAQLWVDEVVVERLLCGAHIGREPTVREKTTAAEILLSRGWSAVRTAKFVGLSEMTVRRRKP